LRRRDLFGLVWLANPADSLCGDETCSASSGWRILRIRFAASRNPMLGLRSELVKLMGI